MYGFPHCRPSGPRRRGRPVGSVKALPKKQTAIRSDADVLEGKGKAYGKMAGGKRLLFPAGPVFYAAGFGKGVPLG